MPESTLLPRCHLGWEQGLGDELWSSVTIANEIRDLRSKKGFHYYTNHNQFIGNFSLHKEIVVTTAITLSFLFVS